MAHFSVITERISEGNETTMVLAVIYNTQWFAAVAVTTTEPHHPTATPSLVQLQYMGVQLRKPYN
jgi:hypothetical protein